MKSDSVAGFFDGFNARHLEPAEVARSFVPSDHFEKLSRATNSLVLGPRGSGKTTLLKMLTQQSLSQWNHDAADRFRQSVNFFGVYVPTDASWGGQLQAVRELPDATQLSELIGYAAFTTHILRSFLRSLQWLAADSGDSKTFHETAIVKRLRDAWQVTSKAKTLASLHADLGKRLLRLGSISLSSAYTADISLEKLLDTDKYLPLQFLDALAFAADALEAEDAKTPERWAILFDELELAPEAIRTQLIHYLRSADQRFLFKLALVPVAPELNDLRKQFAAKERDDYELVELWYSHKGDSYKFSESLWDEMLSSRGLPETSALSALGQSEFDTDTSEWSDDHIRTAYRRGTSISRRFNELASIDRSFAAFLAEKRIDVERMEAVDSDRRAQTLRKVTAIVTLRHALLDQGDDGELRRRSRKSLGLYHGAGVVFATGEGNPRWLKGILGELLDSLGESHEIKLNPKLQERVLLDAASRLVAFAKSVPCPDFSNGDSEIGLMKLISPLGEFFHDAACGDDFSPEPPNSFRVPQDAGDEIVDAVSAAFNLGAIVSLAGAENSDPVGDVRGGRFRLAYVFSPYFRLLPRSGREILLTSIVPEASGLVSEQEGDLPLFPLDEAER